MAIGTEQEGVIGILLRVVLNASETDKSDRDAVIDPATVRESDLLAFKIGIERGQPGALICSYNLVNGSTLAAAKSS